MRYKTKYSESEEYTVYRYFHYTPRQLGIRGFLATTCAAIATFLLVPLPDELFVIPPIAAMLQKLAVMEFETAAFYAYVIYKSIGLLFLIAALVFGIEYVRDAFLAKMKYVKETPKKVQDYVQNGHSNLKKKLARKR